MKDHGQSLQSNQQHQQPQDIAPSPGQLFANCLFSNKMTNGFIPSSSEYHKASWRLNHKAKRNLFPTWPVLACLLCSDLLKASRREAACLWGSGWPGQYPSELGWVPELNGLASMVLTLVGNSVLKPAAAGRSLGECLVLAIPLLSGQCPCSHPPGSCRRAGEKQD